MVNNTALVIIGIILVMGLMVIAKIVMVYKYTKLSRSFVKKTKPGDEISVSVGDGIYKPAKVIENNGDSFKLEIIIDSDRVSAPESFYKQWLTKNKLVKYLFNIR